MSTAISSSSPSYIPGSQPNPLQQNFQSLTSAIQSGNLSAAQQAYSTLTQNAPSQGNGSSNSNPFQQALASIGSALQSGDISGAQGALANMQQSMKAHHGHRHHGGQAGGGSSTAASSTPPSQSSTGIATLSSASNAVNISA